MGGSGQAQPLKHAPCMHAQRGAPGWRGMCAWLSAWPSSCVARSLTRSARHLHEAPGRLLPVQPSCVPGCVCAHGMAWHGVVWRGCAGGAPTSTRCGRALRRTASTWATSRRTSSAGGPEARAQLPLQHHKVKGDATRPIPTYHDRQKHCVHGAPCGHPSMHAASSLGHVLGSAGV